MINGIWFSNKIRSHLISKNNPAEANMGSPPRLRPFIEYLKNSSIMKQPSSNIISTNSSLVRLTLSAKQFLAVCSNSFSAFTHSDRIASSSGFRLSSVYR
ncbi:hypothetical protein L6164_013659 [Bauhinia variegata]|uniref:Uncharacterized protein n=1 Tax=Bauhinia variegata TaxID=167791 RepID=A0ACB9NGA2_BAUVA|nr:hypothetical protein L6164_013659 [Bauhinia variegata]